MARYGTLVAWGTALGMNECVQLLQQTLDEEKKTDAALSSLAAKSLNPAAVSDAEPLVDNAKKPRKAAA